ncbi:MAG: PEP-CTERM sorting domain-containing protein [Proteobacteria bacterium]|nr:PEP-CTERM sorting domain-containing protein [Pseudomonadota bacterium]
MVTQAIYEVAKIAAMAAGIPPILWDFAPDSFLAGDILAFIYYDLLDVDLGLDWDIMQSFLWEPELMIKLATSNGEEYTFAAGDSIDLEMPDSGFDITPTFVLNNTFTNNTDLAIVPEIELTYLGLSIPLFDLNVGPFPTDGPLELPIDIFPPINYNGSFALGFDPFTMASFSIVPSTGPGAEPVPEPATMLLVGSGLIGLAAFRRHRKQVVN